MKPSSSFVKSTRLSCPLSSDQKKGRSANPVPLCFLAMNSNPIRAKQSARFTADRLRHAAKRVALIKVQQDLAGVEGICAMVDDFELLATQQGST